MTTTASELIVNGRVVEFERPLAMGVLNATPDSFSDVVALTELEGQRSRLDELIAAGSDVIDIGAQSAITGVPEISVDEELRRLLPILDEAVERGCLVSVDTYRAAVARVAIEHGAHIVNDTSACSDTDMLGLIAESGAGYVFTHNPGQPKQRLTETDLYDDFNGVVDAVEHGFAEFLGAADAAGVARHQIVLDFGPDFGKTPHQTLACLRAVDRFTSFERPLLYALSRKDIWGAMLNLKPTDRDEVSLAAFLWVADRVRTSIFRTHRPDTLTRALAAIDYLDGRTDLAPQTRLAPELRRTPKTPPT